MLSFQAAPSGHEFTPQRHWSASLEATCRVRRGKTVLSQLQLAGPLNLSALLYDEPAINEVLPAEAILLHPPGGLVSGDELNITLNVEPQARLLVTTPAATKVYGADRHGVPQRQKVRLVVNNSVLEYWPAETIVFDRAQAHLGLTVELMGQGVFIGAETIVLGRKVGNLPLAQGYLSQRTEIKRDGKLLLNEHWQLRLPQDAALLSASCGFNGSSVLCTFYAVGPNLEALAKQLNGQGYAVTYAQEVLIGRWLGSSAAAAERWSLKLWSLVRPVVTGQPARTLRIKNC